jgi:hypothetical protein
MEACGKGLWRLRKNTTGFPPSSKKWIHISGDYYREIETKLTVLDLLRAANAGNSLDRMSQPFMPSSRE